MNPLTWPELQTAVQIAAAAVMLSAGGVVVAGLLQLVQVHQKRGVVRRLLAAARMRIADAQPGTVVKIVGRAVASASGTVWSPLLGQQALVTRTRAIDVPNRERSNTGVGRTLLDIHDTRPLLIVARASGAIPLGHGAP